MLELPSDLFVYYIKVLSGIAVGLSVNNPTSSFVKDIVV